jgi:hypothetical protein
MNHPVHLNQATPGSECIYIIMTDCTPYDWVRKLSFVSTFIQGDFQVLVCEVHILKIYVNAYTVPHPKIKNKKKKQVPFTMLA